MEGTSMSLLTATNCTGHIHVIVGSNPLAAARCAKSIEVGAKPVLVAPATSELHYTLQARVDTGEVIWLRKDFENSDLVEIGREEVGKVVDAVFVTLGPRDPLSKHISTFCKCNRIPVNVTDSPTLSTFSLLSTHTDGPLQIGITTNGRGCKLSSRIRREIACSLPPQLGTACERLGTTRRRIQEEDGNSIAHGLEDDDTEQSSAFNKLVHEADIEAAKSRRIRWLSQICEYWPLSRLASITDSDVESILSSYTTSPTLSSSPPLDPSALDARVAVQAKKGRIILAGSGPGSPHLLTLAAHTALKTATLVLADKLVPASILALIPRRTTIHIARKFPGNADAAQAELLSLALAGLKAGETVLRLKQGDPYLYGRGGEEVDFFKKEGFGDVVTVIPGITSALSAPMFAGIPGTHRGVADQVLICTGTGRKGKNSIPPEYVSSRTVVFLMALHRISSLVADLTTYQAQPQSSLDPGAPATADVTSEVSEEEKSRKLWPLSTPCAIIERASCSDQRVIRTTLEYVAQAIESEGSRPPGLLVLGNACEVLVKLDGARKWVVEEGVGAWGFGALGLDGLDGGNGAGGMEGVGVGVGGLGVVGMGGLAGVEGKLDAAVEKA